MIGLVKFLQTIKLNSKEWPPNFNAHCVIPIGQRVLPEAEVTKRQKAFSNCGSISWLQKSFTYTVLIAPVLIQALQ